MKWLRRIGKGVLWAIAALVLGLLVAAGVYRDQPAA